MSVYFVLKYLHVIGGGCVARHRRRDRILHAHGASARGDAKTVAEVARIVVIADFLFTGTAVVAQPTIGVLLAYVVGYSLWDGWIALSLLLYLVTGMFWLPVVWMQMRMRDVAHRAAWRAVASALSPAVPLVVCVRNASFRRSPCDILADDRQTADRDLFVRTRSRTRSEAPPTIVGGAPHS